MISYKDNAIASMFQNIVTEEVFFNQQN